ncbi:MAG: adenosine deaminase, tRNA-specific 3, partial [Paramarteilia canceri]
NIYEYNISNSLWRSFHPSLKIPSLSENEFKDSLKLCIEIHEEVLNSNHFNMGLLVYNGKVCHKVVKSEANLENDISHVSMELIKLAADHQLMLSKRKDTNIDYLCTGYDIFLYQEPCLLCASALLHARVSRIFFKAENCLLKKGGVSGDCQVQFFEGINHRYN